MSAEVWYLDTSAFLKLIQVEPESDALCAWLSEGREQAASDLLRTESVRVARRAGPEALARCREALARLTLIRVDAAVFEAAGELDLAVLRSLDAVHLAAALTLGSDLAGIVTYDRQLADAARGLGLTIAAPGA